VVKFIPPFDWRAGGFVIDEASRIGVWHSGYNNSTQLYDLSDPLNPAPLERINTYWNEMVSDRIVISFSPNGWIRVTDISDPDEPENVGFYRNDMWINDIFLDNTNLYVAQSNSFLIYNLSSFVDNERQTRLQLGEHQVTLFPNPVNSSATIGYRLASPGKASVAIYDLRGALVNQIAVNQYLSAGEHKTRWDTGLIPAGVYVVRIETSGNTLRKTISVVK
jgi:hypothetical protein